MARRPIATRPPSGEVRGIEQVSQKIHLGISELGLRPRRTQTILRAGGSILCVVRDATTAESFRRSVRSIDILCSPSPSASRIPALFDLLTTDPAGDQDGGPRGLSWRSRPVGTKIVGERFHLYAARAKAKRLVWSDDLAVATPPAGWRSRSFGRHCFWGNVAAFQFSRNEGSVKAKCRHDFKAS